MIADKLKAARTVILTPSLAPTSFSIYIMRKYYLTLFTQYLEWTSFHITLRPIHFSNYISQKTEMNCQNGVSLNTNILTDLQLEVIQSAQRNFTTQPRTAVSPTSSMDFILHGITAMNYPPRHWLATISLWKQYRMQHIQPAHPCWAPYTLVHNPIVARVVIESSLYLYYWY